MVCDKNKLGNIKAYFFFGTREILERLEKQLEILRHEIYGWFFRVSQFLSTIPLMPLLLSHHKNSAVNLSKTYTRKVKSEILALRLTLKKFD
jgi:hypothetical protein